jgi:hypothetical protein
LQRKSLTALAANPDFVAGIYNYCDRWCERCPLTSCCLVYATEQDNDAIPTSRDTENDGFWQNLMQYRAQADELIPEWAKQVGFSLNPPEEHQSSRRRRKPSVDKHPLVKAGKQYANAVSDWFRELDQTIDVSILTFIANAADAAATGTTLDRHVTQPFESVRQVIRWYQYQISVKTMRALSTHNDELDDSETNDLPKDSDGSAKVALIGIDRSIAAWRFMQLSLPERAESIVTLILQLACLRNSLLKGFPKASEFIRPGFDDLLTPPSDS